MLPIAGAAANGCVNTYAAPWVLCLLLWSYPLRRSWSLPGRPNSQNRHRAPSMPASFFLLHPGASTRNNDVRGGRVAPFVTFQGPHRGVRAEFPHTALRDTGSLRGADSARLEQRKPLQNPSHACPGEPALGAMAEPSPPRKTRFRLAALPCRTGVQPVESRNSVSAMWITWNPPSQSFRGAP